MNQHLQTQGVATTEASDAFGSSLEQPATPIPNPVLSHAIAPWSSSLRDVALTYKIITSDNLLVVLDLDKSLASNHAPVSPFSIPEITPESVQAVAQLILQGAKVVIPTGRPTEAVQQNLFGYQPVLDLLSPEELGALHEVRIYGGFGMSHAVGNETPIYEHIKDKHLARVKEVLDVVNAEFGISDREPDWSRGIPLITTDDDTFCEVQVKGRAANVPDSADQTYVPHVVTLYAGTNPISQERKEWAQKIAEHYKVQLVIGADAIEFLPKGFASNKIESLDHFVSRNDMEDVAVVVVGDGHQDMELMKYLCHGEVSDVERTLSICVSDEALFASIPTPRVNVPDPLSPEPYSSEWRQTVAEHKDMRPWEVIGDYLRTMGSIRGEARAAEALSHTSPPHLDFT